MSVTNNLSPFHLAISVHDLALCRKFYGKILGMKEGRSSSKWVDFNFFGHQLVIHETGTKNELIHNQVDGHGVPVPHFGVVLNMNDWEELANRLKSKSVNFVIEPYVRFKGEVGEQATMFFLDPSNNALEFKAFKNLKNLFEK